MLPGDVLLQCSDGLHGAVSRRRNRPHCAAALTTWMPLPAELVASANQKDGGDNVSVQLIRSRAMWSAWECTADGLTSFADGIRFQIDSL